MQTITKWLEKQKDYGMCNPPMDAQTGINFLSDYLDIPPSTMPESPQQTNTYIIFEILYKHSKRFRKEMKALIKNKSR